MQHITLLRAHVHSGPNLFTRLIFSKYRLFNRCTKFSELSGLQYCVQSTIIELLLIENSNLCSSVSLYCTQSLPHVPIQDSTLNGHWRKYTSLTREDPELISMKGLKITTIYIKLYSRSISKNTAPIWQMRVLKSTP